MEKQQAGGSAFRYYHRVLGTIMAMQVAMATPGGLGSNLNNRRKGQALAEWNHWKRVEEVEMKGLMTTIVWTQVERPESS